MSKLDSVALSKLANGRLKMVSGGDVRHAGHEAGREMKPNTDIIAILVSREHSRLSSQVKTLEKALQVPFSDRESLRQKNLAAQWRNLLAFDDGAPKLAEALEAFIAAYLQQSPDRERLHDEVVFQAGIYRMGHWALIKHFIPDVSKSMDKFGGVTAKCREVFKRRYEADRKLTIEEQSQLLKTQYALIPNLSLIHI